MNLFFDAIKYITNNLIDARHDQTPCLWVLAFIWRTHISFSRLNFNLFFFIFSIIYKLVIQTHKIGHWKLFIVSSLYFFINKFIGLTIRVCICAFSAVEFSICILFISNYIVSRCTCKLQSFCFINDFYWLQMIWIYILDKWNRHVVSVNIYCRMFLNCILCGNLRIKFNLAWPKELCLYFIYNSICESFSFQICNYKLKSK